MTPCTWLFVALVSAGGQAAPVPTARDLDARNRRDTATPAGREFERKVVSAFWGDAAFVRECAPPDAPVPEPFTIWLEIKRDGSMGALVMEPETSVAKCIRKRLPPRTFEKPAADFVASIELSFKK
jgi:hypothetical protein